MVKRGREEEMVIREEEREMVVTVKGDVMGMQRWVAVMGEGMGGG